MKSVARSSVALLLALLSGCQAELAPARATGVAPARARLRKLRGDVMLKRAAADDWVAATEKGELRENDKVRTAAGASAVIDFGNGSLATIGEDALLAIAERGEADLTVLKGRVDAQLDQATGSLTLTTPAATIRAGREIVFQ